jgi:uncharacterized protein YjbJ (UPF0337 family)
MPPYMTACTVEQTAARTVWRCRAAGKPVGGMPVGKEPTMGEGATDKAKGRVKEAAGTVTGDDRLKREGKIDRGAGTMDDKVAEGAGTVKDKVAEGAGTVKDKVDQAADKVKDAGRRD